MEWAGNQSLIQDFWAGVPFFIRHPMDDIGLLTVALSSCEDPPGSPNRSSSAEDPHVPPILVPGAGAGAVLPPRRTISMPTWLSSNQEELDCCPPTPYRT